ncbi:MAG: terpene cyclase/mutase family protein [Candidatus Marinimicrobia bacterium]|nr:terpene cyclase/mutase family protein [Candidatus Neomarinimicrobiota bacterium]
MTKSNKWMNMLKKDPVPTLLNKGPLPIRYITAQRFYPHDEELLNFLRAEILRFKPREQLLDTQLPDGLWKTTNKYQIEERNRAISYLLQLQKMTQLHDYGCTRDIPPIQRGIIALLKTQKPDGKFPLLLHHHGYTLWLLAQYDLIGNPFVEKGYRWLAKRQRSDGGWLSPAMVPSGVSIKTTKSGIWTTLFAFQAFSVHSRLRHSEVCRKAATFVLDNYLEKSHTTLFPEQDAWNFLYTDYSDNGLFRGGTLRFIEALAPLADYHSHPSFKKAVNWLLDLQMSSGLLPAVAGISKEGDFATTLRFVSALKEMEKATS